MTPPRPERRSGTFANHVRRVRQRQRDRRGEDTTRVFRMVVAGVALFAGLAWPFFHQYVDAMARLQRAQLRASSGRAVSDSLRHVIDAQRGVDWHSIGFWAFCLLIFLAALSPEIKGFLGNVVDAIKAWKQQKQAE